MSRELKGGDFRNRYRIEGTLKTISPLHVGTGDVDKERVPAVKSGGKVEKVPEVSTVMKDHDGVPMIPGSSLRGVVRHWLLNVLRGEYAEWADVLTDPDEKSLLEKEQGQQIQHIKDNFSVLQVLFGTSFNAGKVEIWDASCAVDDERKKKLTATKSLLHWKEKSLTYVDTSVVINPETGTAQDKLLYQTEVVPAGVEFKFNLVGQNLSDEELGLILFGLQGFNSAIYPICVGARSGRGYGRMCFTLENVYRLQAGDELKQWVERSIAAMGGDNKGGKDSLQENAGYFGLPTLTSDEQKALIRGVKDALLKSAGGA